MTTEEMNKKLEELKDNIENALSEVAKYEELIRQIKAQEEPKFERREGERYYTVGIYRGNTECYELVDDAITDSDRYENNNYFYTGERAQEVADRINFLLKLERLHDIYCPEYVPNWEAREPKYYVAYDYNGNKYSWRYCRYIHPNCACFPTEAIADKVCDILNEEREDNGWKSS